MTAPTRPPSTPGSGRIPGRRRARRGEGELLREEILNAAEALLVERGYQDAVTVRDIAEAVGVSVPAIYLHFADKQELFYDTCRRNFAALNARLVEAVAGEGTVAERLWRAGEAYIRFGLERPGQYLTLFGTGIAAEPPAPGQLEDDPGVQAFGMLVSLLERGVTEGELRPFPDLVATAVAVWATVHGAVNLLITKRGVGPDAPIEIPPDDDVIGATLTLVLGGILNRSS